MVYSEMCYHSLWAKKKKIPCVSDVLLQNFNILQYKCLSKKRNFLLFLLPKVNNLVVGLNALIQQIFYEYLLCARNSPLFLKSL